MPRTFPELLREMERLTKGLPDARKLTKRFAARALPREWDPDEPYDPDALLYCEDRMDLEDGVPVMFLPEGCNAPNDDALVWSQTLMHGDVYHPALIVDAVPCHNDWIALKALYEFGALEIDEHVRDMAPAVHRFHRGISEEGLAFQIAGARSHLSARLDAMIAYLIDREMRGRMTKEVERLRRSRTAGMNDGDFAAELTNQILLALNHTWPDAANREEYHARCTLLVCAARGVIFRNINPPPQI